MNNDQTTFHMVLFFLCKMTAFSLELGILAKVQLSLLASFFSSITPFINLKLLIFLQLHPLLTLNF
jgi:hypothetical protein